ncbi:MAG: hypothetical protein ACT4N8_03010, partial [Sphingosinicella sp.]
MAADHTPELHFLCLRCRLSSSFGKAQERQPVLLTRCGLWVGVRASDMRPLLLSSFAAAFLVCCSSSAIEQRATLCIERPEQHGRLNIIP